MSGFDPVLKGQIDEKVLNASYQLFGANKIGESVCQFEVKKKKHSVIGGRSAVFHFLRFHIIRYPFQVIALT